MSENGTWCWIVQNATRTRLTYTYTPHILWVTWGTGTPKDRDEVIDEMFESEMGEFVN